jgi:hypothetical protein
MPGPAGCVQYGEDKEQSRQPICQSDIEAGHLMHRQSRLPDQRHGSTGVLRPLDIEFNQATERAVKIGLVCLRGHDETPRLFVAA